MGNRHLNAAQYGRGMGDEFYTDIDEVRRVLGGFPPDWCVDKIVLCPCNDIGRAFYAYFVENFQRLKLQRLVATSYAPGGRGEVMTLDGGGESVAVLDGDGDFRSIECRKLIEQADIVATNPPFSTSNELIAMLMERGKQLVLLNGMASLNRISPFRYIQRGELCVLGKHKAKFLCQDNSKRLNGAVWITNIGVSDVYAARPFYQLGKRYAGHEDEYPPYWGIAAIYVDKPKNIPCDYTGLMGVPITFLEHFTDRQFELLGQTEAWSLKETCGAYVIPPEKRKPLTRDFPAEHLRKFLGKSRHRVVTIVDHTTVLRDVYSRILIRNRYPEARYADN